MHDSVVYAYAYVFFACLMALGLLAEGSNMFAEKEQHQTLSLIRLVSGIHVVVLQPRQPPPLTCSLMLLVGLVGYHVIC